jgi:hypothetical protein
VDSKWLEGHDIVGTFKKGSLSLNKYFPYHANGRTGYYQKDFAIIWFHVPVFLKLGDKRWIDFQESLEFIDGYHQIMFIRSDKFKEIFRCIYFYVSRKFQLFLYYLVELIHQNINALIAVNKKIN